ncbi:unnamed protein product [Soboliphyme baturini]|uniref:KOW domain-containing protein n=1 Tax=Soboliphyme baturini TaxID=241478 RepID=A0A183JA00_9BILA|nr:unnamed protein product [Soboliphyme baturini]
METSERITEMDNFPKAYIEKVKKTVPKKVFGNLTFFHCLYSVVNFLISDREQKKAEYEKRLRRRFKIETPKVDVIPDDKWWIFRGDRVEILVGKDKGKQGLVNYVVRERNWCYVDGLNCKYETVGAAKELGFNGTLRKIERPLDVRTEVALVDPADLKPTQVEWKWDEKGERVRCSLRTGYVIPTPMKSEETFEYTTRETYVGKWLLFSSSHGRLNERLKHNDF